MALISLEKVVCNFCGSEDTYINGLNGIECPTVDCKNYSKIQHNEILKRHGMQNGNEVVRPFEFSNLHVLDKISFKPKFLEENGASGYGYVLDQNTKNCLFIVEFDNEKRITIRHEDFHNVVGVVRTERTMSTVKIGTDYVFESKYKDEVSFVKYSEPFVMTFTIHETLQNDPNSEGITFLVQ